MVRFQPFSQASHCHSFVLAYAGAADPHDQGDLVLGADCTKAIDRRTQFHSIYKDPQCRHPVNWGNVKVACHSGHPPDHRLAMEGKPRLPSRVCNLVPSHFVFTIVTQSRPCRHQLPVGFLADQINQIFPALLLIINPMPPSSCTLGTAAITEDMLKRRWSASILRYLDRGVTDPAEITKNEVKLTPAIITKRLRTMLRYALVARFPMPSPSKAVEFRLTPRGKKILKMLDIIDQLDRLDQRLTLNGKSIEETLGLTVAAIPDTPPKPAAPVASKTAKTKKTQPLSRSTTVL
jgi:DNA-binding HxlR family transcriptional regulator